MKKLGLCFLTICLEVVAVIAQGQLKPFLIVPLQEKERATVTISQGWKYADDERRLHPGIPTHFGIDFRCKRGTPVLAPADGVCFGSCHLFYLDDLFKGKRIGFGLGHFVVIWHPQTQVYSLYAHLERINGDIVPYFKPVAKGDGWDPSVIYQSVGAILAMKNEQGQTPEPVKRGQVIGYVGDTGLTLLGDGETPDFRPDPEQFPTWDPAGPHLHWEVYTRTADGARKDKRFDPFDLYGECDTYKDVFKSPARGLLVPDATTGFPQFSG